MNTEAYMQCEQGHQHWGLAGAAGLFLLTDSPEGPRVLLQHRSPEVHEGDVWGIPGGALAWGEDALSGAVREVEEELGFALPALTPIGEVRADHGDWAYTTVVARTEVFDLPRDGQGWETGEHGFAWVCLSDLPLRDLHPGLRGALAALLALVPTVV